MTDEKYPIGEFDGAAGADADDRPRLIAEIAAVPRLLRAAVAGLNETQLDTPYRQEGWTVRQVVHHLPDSHMNSYVRFRLALTEDRPLIRGYDEAAWATLFDAKAAPVAPSLNLLESLHERWVMLLESVTEEQWQRALVHPEHGELSLSRMLALYAWHGRHHVAHITALRERAGWS